MLEIKYNISLRPVKAILLAGKSLSATYKDFCFEKKTEPSFLTSTLSQTEWEASINLPWLDSIDVYSCYYAII